MVRAGLENLGLRPRFLRAGFGSNITLRMSPTTPQVMSVWISTIGIISSACLPNLSTTTTLALSNATSNPGTTSAAYHWPAAPVQNFDLVPFFAGINARINPRTVTVLGYLFSYGWNDQCRFLTSGLAELGNRIGQEDDAVNKATNKKTAANGKKNKDDFDLEQWAFVKLGWRDFQTDLAEAARLGVKVWRMKVCVLTVTK